MWIFLLKMVLFQFANCGNVDRRVPSGTPRKTSGGSPKMQHLGGLESGASIAGWMVREHIKSKMDDWGLPP